MTGSSNEAHRPHSQNHQHHHKAHRTDRQSYHKRGYGHSHHNQLQRRLDDHYKDDKLLSPTHFEKYSVAKDDAENTNTTHSPSTYTQYKQAHRHEALERFYTVHKKRAWFKDYLAAMDSEKFAAICEEKQKASEDFRKLLFSGALDKICMVDGEDLTMSSSSDNNNSTVDDNVVAVGSNRNLSGDNATVKTAASFSSFKTFSKSASLPERLQHTLPTTPTNYISLSNISPAMSKNDLQALLNDCSEGALSHLFLSEPDPSKSFYRIGWATFQPDSNLTLIVSNVEERIVGGDKIYGSTCKSFTGKLAVLPPSHSQEERLAMDLDLLKMAVAGFDAKYSVPSWMFAKEGVLEGEEKWSISQQVDIAVTYLASLYNYSHYGQCLGECALDMVNQCNGIHAFIRAPPQQQEAPPSLDKNDLEQKTENSVTDTNEAFRAKTLDLLERALFTLSSPSISTTDKYLAQKHIIKIEEGRVRCSQCEKLFKGPEFVLKHLRAKHPSFVADVELEVKLINVLETKPPLCAVLPANSGAEEGASPTLSSGLSSSADYRQNHHSGGRKRSLPPPPPPKDARYDSRPIRKYVDWDAPATGDVEISYD